MRLLVTLVLLAVPLRSQRQTVPLDGMWEIAESMAAEPPPAAYPGRVPVPGLANLAEPPFPDVDRFDSVEAIDKKIRLKLLPPSTPLPAIGVPLQKRNYFWYRTRFHAPARRAVARLKVNKAQFGTAVWLNGRRMGEHPGCFTAGFFDLTSAMRWQAENELTIRIGAHPAVLPETVPSGTDNEKLLWTPGIYDSVWLLVSDNPVIESVQVAPRLAPRQIQVQTVLRSYGEGGAFQLTHRVNGRVKTEIVQLAAGEEQTLLHTIPMPGARLWSPESPALHTIVTSTTPAPGPQSRAPARGDSLTTRFGIREIRFDTPTRRAYLNGRPYFLRGSNITLHRFFEDPQCKRLPWDEAWVRKLLIDIPKRLHWNSFRFCIGPVPDKWLDIADEAGLLIQNEFFVWGYRKQWDTAGMVRQYREWMRDNWNHPSVAVWDADNETRADVLGDIIEQVRGLDLSNRAWDNGYNLPTGPDDPIEDHPYLFSRLGKGFEIPDLERMTGAKSTNSPHPSSHAAILNEYGWLWLNRDGSPTELTKDVYARLLGPDSTAAQRFEWNAYLLGGLTEFWRAHRNFAGVLHFVYLTCSYPGGYTADHWRDLARLELEPRFEDYITEAFKPLGVYLNFWQPKLEGGAGRRFAVMLVNDAQEIAQGKLALVLEGEGGREVARAERAFRVAGFGQQSYHFDLRLPAHQGECLLKATATSGTGKTTVSRRKLRLG